MLKRARRPKPQKRRLLQHFDHPLMVHINEIREVHQHLNCNAAAPLTTLDPRDRIHQVAQCLENRISLIVGNTPWILWYRDSYISQGGHGVVILLLVTIARDYGPPDISAGWYSQAGLEEGG